MRRWTPMELAAALMLSGCFTSKTAMITAAVADTPFPDGATFTEFGNCATVTLLQGACTGYKAQGTGSVSLKQSVYTFNPDPGDDTAAVAAAQGGGGADMTALVKRIGDGLYVVQLPLGAPTSDASIPLDNYFYAFLRLEGKAAYVYIFTCEESGDRRYVRSGHLAAVTKSLFGASCEVGDVRKLAKIFRDRVANGAQPDKKFEFSAINPGV